MALAGKRRCQGAYSLWLLRRENSVDAYPQRLGNPSSDREGRRLATALYLTDVAVLNTNSYGQLSLCKPTLLAVVANSVFDRCIHVCPPPVITYSIVYTV